ncbi:MAG: YbhB/YbcL family Raf kinase inhibitor-like protein [Burkholderiales bacterium]|nr:YbhB/YbcL family Raf kinase inhibitor-like protein [Burkholderiales bacterium]
MKLWSNSFVDQAAIPAEFAFVAIDPTRHVALSENTNPHLAWDETPTGTQSLVLICHDKDVPSRGDDVNQEGREVPDSLPRVDFFHWILIDIPPTWREIEAGSHSHGVTPRGKAGPVIPNIDNGMRHGINDYTGWFANDPDMRGEYYGYDGPSPPWNDSLVHHYIFTLYALDIAKLEIGGQITGPVVREAIKKHILAESAITGRYTLNPRLII